VITRRTFLYGLTLGTPATALSAEAQQAGKVYRIGHVSPVDFDRPERMEQRSWPAFIQGLRSRGWVEGKNIVFERHPTHDLTSLQQAAKEFVRIKVDVIVLVGGARAAVVQKVTRTIPIVTLTSGDLVASGIVPSLARPAGNITGMQSYAPEMMGKRLQMLKELIPALARVAVLRRGSWSPGILGVYRQATDDAAKKLGIGVRYVQFEKPDALPGVFAEMVKERDTALLIWDDPRVDQVAPQILDLAVKHRIPTIVDDAQWAKIGALMAYGPKADDLYRQAATYVDRILRGAKPADLPIGQPTTFELICNLKTAKALGLTIPQAILLMADQVIEH
jgi:putative ABC transport system substrate-binding protein